MPPPAPHLVDELLEEIFLRLPTPAALARASTASPRFRRIITDRSFLRRFRKLHPPPLLGFADERAGFHPAEAPHPSAPLARTLADAADFTYSFVPKPSNDHSWRPCNVRDGRVLLEGSRYEIFRKLAVCDPLSRRYVLLPPIPDHMSVQEQSPWEFRSILAPIAEEDEDETSFKVICFADYETKLDVFVFSSVTRQWCIAASPSWSSLGADRPWGLRVVSQGSRGFSCFDHVRGCFYSASPWKDKLLVLDTRTMEISTVNDRTGYRMQLRWLPGQAEDVSARDHMLDRQRPAQDTNTESSKEWQLDNIVPLPGQYDYFTAGAAEGFLFLGATSEDQLDIDEDSPVWLSKTDWDVDYFSLDVKTSELAKVCRRKKKFFHYEDVYWDKHIWSLLFGLCDAFEKKWRICWLDIVLEPWYYLSGTIHYVLHYICPCAAYFRKTCCRR
ncbi:uncharacterized protein LOC119326075 isoform X2 [Triticum dicoccoides]|uniref:uncharacterized protein LOC119326075 isoform X2 n=1 Tax=Triticum dicoccoides TaxID=85692 RepID=UPI001890DF7B|nr:uncharacterized protein LOC119326075 isoform X2 [Triticum dicoccoides]XP_044411408.1 uncharacterized protein LOC123136161 isoform X2 [Triticum aestivum]